MTIFKKKVIKNPIDKQEVCLDILDYLKHDFNCYLISTSDREELYDFAITRNVTRDVSISINHHSRTETQNLQQVFLIKVADEEDSLKNPPDNLLMHISAFIVVSSLDQLKYRLESLGS